MGKSAWTDADLEDMGWLMYEYGYTLYVRQKLQYVNEQQLTLKQREGISFDKLSVKL